VAFIMSVHIAEVLQIFICIAVGMPVMRTPVQILFLILVTDLPPSIALGMEPAEKGILKQRPRPKSEPVVLGWMWLNMVMNAFILSAVVIAVYVVALMHFLEDRVLIEDIDFSGLIKPDDEKHLMYARTVAFISLVFCENVRSYTSRSFDKPVWKNICGNKAMHAAIIAAQVALYVAVLTPFLSDEILELDGIEIGAWGWGVAACGPVATLILCELSKFVTAFQIRQHQRRLAKAEELAQENKSAAAVEVMDQPARVKSGPLARQDSYNRLNEQNAVTV